MARDLNKVMLIGRLGTDPDLRYTPNGTPVATLRLACNRRRAPSAEGEQREETDWFTVVVWNKLAELIGNNQLSVTKGSRIYVEGRLQTRSWDDQQTGQRRTVVEVVANDIILLDSRNRQAERSDEPDLDTQEGLGDSSDIEIDDINF